LDGASGWTTDDDMLDGLASPHVAAELPSTDGSEDEDPMHTSSHGAAESQSVDDEMLDYQEALLNDLMSPNGAVGSQPAGDVGSEDINALVAGSAGDSETGSDLEFGQMF